MTPDTIKRDVRAFLDRFIRNYTLQDNEDIFARGFVNSLFAMQLVMFVEQTYGITVEDDDLNMDNFRSIDAITSLVMRKRM